MDRIDLIEENLNNTQTQNIDMDVKAAVNDIVDAMKSMLGMIKISLQNSSPSNVLQNLEPFIQSAVQNAYSEDLINKEKKIEALQRIIMNNEHKIEESELYSNHLERRISLLEDCTRQQIEETEKHTEEPPTLEDIVIATDTFSDDDNSHSDTETVSVTATTQQTNLDSSLSLSNNDLVMEDVSTTLRPQPEDTLNIDLDLNDDNHALSKEDTIKKILKMHQSAEDEKTKRTVLFSNIDYPSVPEAVHDKMNFWPNLRMQLRCLGLENIMTGAEKIIKLKSGALRITYRTASDARFVINSLRAKIGYMKTARRNEYGLFENGFGQAIDDVTVSRVMKIKFTRLIPNRFNTERKKLQKLGNFLKAQKKIVWFDLHVIKGSVILKTKWRAQNLHGAGGRTCYRKKFTHYNVEQAEDILSGVLDIDERLDRDRSNEIIRQ